MWLVLLARRLSLMVHFPSSFLSFRRYVQDLCPWQDFRGSRVVERYSPFTRYQTWYASEHLLLAVPKCILFWTCLPNGLFFFRSEKLRVLFVSTLIIKPFLSRPRKKFAEHTRRVCPLFVNHHVCCQSIAFISVCKTLCV